METRNFGTALKALKNGYKVAREGWNGKGMWLKLISEKEYQVEVELGHPKQLAWIGIKTTDDCFAPWLASQTDILAEDWTVIN